MYILKEIEILCRLPIALQLLALVPQGGFCHLQEFQTAHPGYDSFHYSAIEIQYVCVHVGMEEMQIALCSNF